MSTGALDSIPLSALQHWCYCPRQCALIHVEQVFAENLHTLRGQALHQRVDDPGFEVRQGLRVERALPLFNDRLGLSGKADVVEFLPDGTPYPVEYKHGSRHKRADIAACDDVQLAAQALCLEEMFGRTVDEGALYYASSRRRRVVRIDDPLRRRVEDTILAVREALASGAMPSPRNDERCRACSLRDLCQPEALASAASYNRQLLSLFEPGD
ncbi:MAG: CRISPR-associated protein Cas4 [Dokdonella sp.]|nr:MAG: CRISPR-associated protein Cas4 [Dokdonella sp.]